MYKLFRSTLIDNVLCWNIVHYRCVAARVSADGGYGGVVAVEVLETFRRDVLPEDLLVVLLINLLQRVRQRTQPRQRLVVPQILEEDSTLVRAAKNRFILY